MKMTNIIKQMVSNANSVHYEWAHIRVGKGRRVYVAGCSSADFKEIEAVKWDNEIMRLCLSFTTDTYDETLFVDVKTGKAYYWKYDGTNEMPIRPLGKIDSQDYDSLLPIYNKVFKYGLFKNTEGIRDDFINLGGVLAK